MSFTLCPRIGWSAIRSTSSPSNQTFRPSSREARYCSPVFMYGPLGVRLHTDAAQQEVGEAVDDLGHGQIAVGAEPRLDGVEGREDRRCREPRVEVRGEGALPLPLADDLADRALVGVPARDD